MTPSEIKVLVETLRACGVTHYKEGELELNLGPIPVAVDPIEKKKNEEVLADAQKHADQFFNDNYLIDKLFPTGIPIDEESAEEPASNT